MLWLKYKMNGADALMGWNEINEEVAKREADDGNPIIFDDGLPENMPVEQRISALEEALELLLSGVTE